MVHIEEALIFEVIILDHSKMQGNHLQKDYETQRAKQSKCLNELLQELLVHIFR